MSTNTTKSETEVRLSEIVPNHPKKYFNLGSEPWIPVETQKGSERLGFNDLLYRCHEVIDLRVGDPLARFALLRYLLALTYLAYAYNREGAWKEVVEGGATLPKGGIEAVINRMKDSWWLFHPDTPFAQIPQLRTEMHKTFTAQDGLIEATEGFETLVPYRPSKNNEIWWYKPDDRGLPCSEAALVLLTRHYAATPGNEAGILRETKSRCEGGLMVYGPLELTSLVVGLPNLASLLAENLIESIANNISDQSKLFFEAPTKVAENIDDPLYLYSASTAAAYLVWPGEGNNITRVLRAPLPIESNTAKELIKAARMRDPHVLRLKTEIGSPNPGTNKGLISFSATATQFENVFSLYKRSADGISGFQSCVIDPNARLFGIKRSETSLEGVTVSGGGNYSGTRIEAVVQVTLDPKPLLLETRQARAFSLLVGKLAGGKDACLFRLTNAINKVIAGESARISNTRRAALFNRAQTLLWSHLDSSVSRLYQDIANSPNGPWPETLPEETKKEWIEQTMAVFNILVAPYEHAPRTRSKVVEYRNQLKANLRRTL
jgi:hypothetical protein